MLLNSKPVYACDKSDCFNEVAELYIKSIAESCNHKVLNCIINYGPTAVQPFAINNIKTEIVSLPQNYTTYAVERSKL